MPTADPAAGHVGANSRSARAPAGSRLADTRARIRICVCVFLALMSYSHVSKAQEIWLSPKFGPNGAADFMDLFKTTAPWQQVASHVNTFGISVEVMGEAPESDLRRLFADIRRRHIGLGLDMLPLSGPDRDGTPQCGYHVEGYSAATETLRLAQRIKSLGGQPQSYGMDEPLLYGHYYTGPNACRSSIEDVARNAAIRVQQARSIFPDVAVGDAEPIQAFPDATWQSDTERWLDAFRAATGGPLAFFAVDIGWGSPTWKTRIPILANLLHRRGIRLVVIYNGDDNARSDDAWAKQIATHYTDFEKSISTRPDVICFSTWVSHPTHVLPESDPQSFTGIINRYLTWHASRH